MFEKLKYYLLKRAIRRTAPRETAFVSYNHLHSVLIIYESNIMEKNPFISQIVKRFQQENIEVTTIGYVDKKEIISPIFPTSRMLFPADCTLTGNLREEAIQYIRSRQYDLLIDLTQNNCLPLRYAALYAQCKFKVGRLQHDNLLDFMIDMPAEEDYRPLFEQIIFYLRNIKSND